MLFTTSTVKDTLPNVQRFVAGNLAGGADHLFVLLDAADPEVEEFLDDHPNVTGVPTDETWWHGERPIELNTRQRVNANVVKALLSACPWADWVFHIDADEVVQIDREALAKVPAESRVVHLDPFEVVSRKHWDGHPTWFKGLLGKGDLTLLHKLGVIEHPTNEAYFHGHVAGKSGLRPALDLWLTVHSVVDDELARVPPYTHDELRLLHYESYSGEEFVRKWTSILRAGLAGFRQDRESTALALQTLILKGLDEEQAASYLMKIYERTTEDDFDTLHDLGLLLEIDRDRDPHVPEEFPDGARAQLTTLVDRIREGPKRPFDRGAPVDAARGLLDEARSPAARGPDVQAPSRQGPSGQGSA